MGKLVCTEVDEGNGFLNVSPLFLAIVIAVIFLFISCMSPPPRRRFVAVRFH
ncbi:hypothetical protein RND71_024684 [Anisodus tanguticus]|uniref:Transmembrane protein n=1 Tax=Anisodus tanguticus TaxID=243964 RepID=A0AAE1RRP8_9SOLA|nr:hypothetical protein RND71_024684 [Anisodus tanguticus]